MAVTRESWEAAVSKINSIADQRGAEDWKDIAKLVINETVDITGVKNTVKLFYEYPKYKELDAVDVCERVETYLPRYRDGKSSLDFFHYFAYSFRRYEDSKEEELLSADALAEKGRELRAKPQKARPDTHAKTIALFETALNDGFRRNTNRPGCKAICTRIATRALAGADKFFVEEYPDVRGIMQAYTDDDLSRIEQRQTDKAPQFIDEEELSDWCKAMSIFHPPLACHMFADGEVYALAPLRVKALSLGMQVGTHHLSSLEPFIQKVARAVFSSYAEQMGVSE